MANESYLNKFNEIYDATYSDILRYVIIKCHNINDANDIIQEIYLEFWKILNKKEIIYSNINSFLIGIAINKIKKHYTIVQRLKNISIFDKNTDIESKVSNNIDIEKMLIEKEEWDLVWNYIKNKKNQNIPKIFFLHYVLDLSIKEISKELMLNESYVKNNIYRTLKELSSLYGKG